MEYMVCFTVLVILTSDNNVYTSCMVYSVSCIVCGLMCGWCKQGKAHPHALPFLLLVFYIANCSNVVNLCALYVHLSCYTELKGSVDKER